MGYLKMSSHVLRSTRCRIPPYLSNRSQSIYYERLETLNAQIYDRSRLIVVFRA